MNWETAGRPGVLWVVIVVCAVAAVTAVPSAVAALGVDGGSGSLSQGAPHEGDARGPVVESGRETGASAGLVAGSGPTVPQADGGGTSLEAEVNRSTASFDRPALIRGELRTSAGYPIAGNQVTIHVGERTYEPTTDSDGAFTITYRPVAIEAGTSTVEVTYEAAEGIAYTNASTTVPLSIRQVTPDLSVSATPDRVRFGENLTVTTTAAVDGHMVPDLPISIEAAGTEISTLRTDDSGFVAGEWTLPVEVSAGDTEVVASVAQSADAAVGPTNATMPVTVERTPTTLSMDANWSGETVVIDGRLATETSGGTPLPTNLSVEMTVAGEDETIRTGPNGTFTLSIREALLEQPDDALPVTAAFDGEGTNLGSSQIERTYDVARLRGSSTEIREFAVMAYAAAAFLVLVVVAIIGRRRRRASGSSLPDTTDSTLGSSGHPSGTPAPGQQDATAGQSGTADTDARDQAAGSEPVGGQPPLPDEVVSDGPGDGSGATTGADEGQVDVSEPATDTTDGAAVDGPDGTAAGTDERTDAETGEAGETGEESDPGAADPSQSSVADGDLTGLLGKAAERSAERAGEQWLADARAALADGNGDQAVAGAYAAAHRHVTVVLGLERALPPRKLLAAADTHLEPGALTALETLTDAYEHVVFTSDAPGAVDQVAVDAAGTVLSVVKSHQGRGDD